MATHRFTTVEEKAIDINNPFKDDKLDRKFCADNLTRIIETISTPSVISVNAPWGGGKSFFITRWSQLLKNTGFHVISFNAWQHDYAENPLMSFISHIEEQIQSNKNTSLKDDIIKTMKHSAAKFMLLGGEIVLDYATRGALNRALEREEANAVADIVSEYASVEINRQKTAQAVLEEFRNKLSEFAHQLTQGQKPVVVVIDELDRCRPSHAVDLLEQIKHVLTVKGIVYILAIDRIQLCATIQGTFGENLDCDAYLRRFIDLNITIPTPDFKKYCLHLIDEFRIKDEERTMFGGASLAIMGKLLAELCESLGFSLREANQLFSRLALIRSMSDTPRWYYICDSLVFLVVLQEVDYSFYENCMREGGVVETIRKLQADSRFDRARNSKYFQRCTGQLIALLTPVEFELPHEIGFRHDPVVKEAFDEVRRHGDLMEYQARIFLRTCIEMSGNI